MMARTWNNRFLHALIIVILAAMCLTGCKDESKGTEAVDKSAYSITKDGTDSKTEELDMDKNEVLAAIQKTFGENFSEYTEDACGVRAGSRYYVDLTIRKGLEQEIEQAIIDLCGRGVDASTRRRPVLDNGLSESLNSAELLTVYDHLRSGANVQTISTTVYTAVVDGNSHVFIFGG